MFKISSALRVRNSSTSLSILHLLILRLGFHLDWFGSGWIFRLISILWLFLVRCRYRWVTFSVSSWIVSLQRAAPFMLSARAAAAAAAASSSISTATSLFIVESGSIGFISSSTSLTRTRTWAIAREIVRARVLPVLVPRGWAHAAGERAVSWFISGNW